jgi:hypothetical protein
MDTVSGKGFDLDNKDELRLSGGWSSGHGQGSLGSVGVMKGAGVVLAEPGVLEGVRAVDFMGLEKEKPEVAKRFPREELKLRNGVLIGDWPSKVRSKGVDRCFG